MIRRGALLRPDERPDREDEQDREGSEGERDGSNRSGQWFWHENDLSVRRKLAIYSATTYLERVMAWKKMKLRDSTVLARVTDDGEPAVVRGKVEVRYGPKSPKAYHAGASNLTAIAGEKVLPDEHCVAADEDSGPKSASKSKSEGGAHPR